MAGYLIGVVAFVLPFALGLTGIGRSNIVLGVGGVLAVAWVISLAQNRATDSKGNDFVERFKREARSVAQLQHPNIVTVIDRGEEEGRQYIVFEYIEGENLKELVVRKGRLDVHEALEIALEVARGLAFAHQNGLVHR